MLAVGEEQSTVDHNESYLRELETLQWRALLVLEIEVKESILLSNNCRTKGNKTPPLLYQYFDLKNAPWG